MRVIHCIASMKGGGAERQLCYLAKGLVDHGHEVHIIILEKGINYNRLLNSRAIVHEINYKNNYDPRIIISIIKIIRLVKPNILQSWQRPMNLFASVAALFSGVPFVLAERTNPGIFAKTFKGLLGILIAQFASGIVANSNVGVLFWSSKLLRKIPIIYLPNLLPVSEICNVKKSVSGKGNVIIIVGRLSPEKNHETLLKAIASVEFMAMDFKVIIVGDGELKDYLLGLTKYMGLEEIISIIPFSLNVWDLMVSADLFVSLSHYEGMPNVVLESAALKTPMLLSRIPEHTNLFTENDCLLVDQNDVQDVSKNIFYALNNIDSLSLLSKNAFRKIQKFQIDDIIPFYVRFYSNIID
jgi:glycosyltransferase involved in cell wall biosynthesis